MFKQDSYLRTLLKEIGIPITHRLIPTKTVSVSLKSVDRDNQARQKLIAEGFCPDCGSPAHDGPCPRA